MSKTKIFAHRGASGYAPENTLEAFALAITQGADGIELDVQLTKDDTLKELKELTVLKNKFPEYSAAKIPTLEEVLDAVKASGIQVNIELKTGIYWYPEIEQKVADLVKKAGMEERVIYSSFNHYSIQQMKKMADFLKEYLGSNLNVRVWTVNEKADMKWLIDAGVTAIITNYPDMAVQIKKEAEV